MFGMLSVFFKMSTRFKEKLSHKSLSISCRCSVISVENSFRLELRIFFNN